MSESPSDEEGLRLMLAFVRIRDASKRAEVLALAERFANLERFGVDLEGRLTRAPRRMKRDI